MKQTKTQKLETADEVYGWYERYVQNPDKSKEPKMAFGTWLAHSLGKQRKGETKIESLSLWEWGTLVAAWRYYELRSTIASAMFPADVVERFWRSGRYADAVLKQIARQFAEIDHGADGERFWSKDKTSHDSDRRAWCKFYAFCKAHCDGFSTVVMDGDLDDGTHVHASPMCFHCECTGRWYQVDDYIHNPRIEIYCADEFIVEVHK